MIKVRLLPTSRDLAERLRPTIDHNLVSTGVGWAVVLASCEVRMSRMNAEGAPMKNTPHTRTAPTTAPRRARSARRMSEMPSTMRSAISGKTPQTLIEVATPRLAPAARSRQVLAGRPAGKAQAIAIRQKATR
jgi:hypothetical protein